MSEKSWDHGSHTAFYDYYAAESQSAATESRFRSIQAAVLRVAQKSALPPVLDVADIGCGAGTQARLWAELGHRVRGLDINGPLIELARERAKSQGLDIRFEVGSATALPWTDSSVHVCLLPELLEHVADWQSCLREAARVLKPRGLLYVSTTNVLCPIQDEFTLPGYSWYPRPIKRHIERLAVSTRPALANYAKYPAVHWFSFYGLRDFLAPLGFGCFDRFDLVDDSRKGAAAKTLLRALRRVAPLRFIGHVATSGTYLVGVKR